MKIINPLHLSNMYLWCCNGIYITTSIYIVGINANKRWSHVN